MFKLALPVSRDRSFVDPFDLGSCCIARIEDFANTAVGSGRPRSGKVVGDKRHPVDEKYRRTPFTGLFGLAQFATEQVPTGDVQVWLPKNLYAVEDRRGQIDPPLIREQSAFAFVETVFIQSCSPPLYKCLAFIISTDEQVAQIVYSVFRDRHFSQSNADHAFLGCENVRHQPDGGRSEIFVDRIERMKKINIGIEIGDDLGILFVQQSFEGAPFDGCAKFHDVVLEDPVTLISKIAWRPDLVEGFVISVQPIRQRVVQA